MDPVCPGIHLPLLAFVISLLGFKLHRIKDSSAESLEELSAYHKPLSVYFTEERELPPVPAPALSTTEVSLPTSHTQHQQAKRIARLGGITCTLDQDYLRLHHLFQGPTGALSSQPFWALFFFLTACLLGRKTIPIHMVVINFMTLNFFPSGRNTVQPTTSSC